MSSTRDRILDAAENLFADKGFGATSLRAITSLAGVNVAAVNYHFGTKDALIQAVFHRLLDPVNRDRLELLNRVETHRADPDLESVVRAFLVPPWQLMQSSARGRVVVRLFGRLYTEATPAVRQGVLGQFTEVVRRFVEALQRALPHLSEPEVVCRFHFMVGAMLHTMSGWQLLRDDEMAPECDPLEPPAMMDRLVGFVTAGFQGPAPSGETALVRAEDR